MSYPKIPPQTQGGSHDTVSMHCANSVEVAKINYDQLKMRLLAVNEWHKLSEKVKSNFTLYDASQHIKTQTLKIGQFIKIDIPGPGSPSGHGYDWVKVVDIQTDDKHPDFSYYAFTVKPCAAPDATDAVIAHFYNGQATSTFIVKRIGTCIYAEVCGRNEIDNTTEVPVLDVVRNKAVAVGSKLGFGKLNWLGLTVALLEPFKR